MYDNPERGYDLHLTQHAQTKMALGSEVTFRLVAASSQDLDDVFISLWQLVYSFERKFSRFLPASELSAFNRGAGQKNPVSAEFHTLLAVAKALGETTAGLYNPFILPALQRAGYMNSAAPGYEGDAAIDYSQRAVAHVDQLVIGDTWASIPFNTALDMGGCGKGYLADQLRDELAFQGLTGYQLSFGGDITTYGHDEHDEPWTIYIQDADNLSGRHALAVVCPVEPFAVATSGTFRRSNQPATKGWHHIIDPTTLEPAVTDVRLATVCAPMTLNADVLASCAAILGSRRAPEFLTDRSAMAMLLQCQDQSRKYDAKIDRSTDHILLKTIS